jgi:hypothetical protein
MEDKIAKCPVCEKEIIADTLNKMVNKWQRHMLIEHPNLEDRTISS